MMNKYLFDAMVSAEIDRANREDPDATEDAPPSGYHPGGVRPEACRCPECWTDEALAEHDRDREEDERQWLAKGDASRPF